MTAEKLALEVLQYIQVWSQATDRLIIAIDGYAGSGKTTITNELLKLYPKEIEVIHLDDFIQPVEKRIEMIHSFPDPPTAFEKHWYRFDILREVLLAFKMNTHTAYEITLYNFDKNTLSRKHTYNLRKRILLVEGIFLFHPKNILSEYFDKKIFLDTPFEIADSRRIQREKEKWGKNYLDESHPDNWTRHFITAYKRYYSTYHPDIISDIIFENSI